MTREEARANLRDILAELYPGEGSARVVVSDAGLNEQRIAFSGTAVNTWHSILREAENSGKIEKLFNVVLGEYSGNQEIVHAIDEYRLFIGDNVQDGAEGTGKQTQPAPPRPSEPLPAFQISSPTSGQFIASPRFSIFGKGAIPEEDNSLYVKLRHVQTGDEEDALGEFTYESDGTWRFDSVVLDAPGAYDLIIDAIFAGVSESEVIRINYRPNVPPPTTSESPTPNQPSGSQNRAFPNMSCNTQVTVALISLVGVIFSAYFGYRQVIVPQLITIRATQTAEAVAPISTDTPEPSPTFTTEPPPTSAETSKPEPTDDSDLSKAIGYTTGFVYLREGPGTEYKSIRQLPPGIEVEIVGGQGDWLRVVVLNQSGFVNRNYISTSPPVQSPALPTQAREAGVSIGTSVANVTNCRSGRTLLDPEEGQSTYRGYVPVKGEASLGFAEGYQLSYTGAAEASSEASFTHLVSSLVPKGSGTLGIWDTRALEPGDYVVRLSSLTGFADDDCRILVSVLGLPQPAGEPAYDTVTSQLPQGPGTLRPAPGEAFSRSTSEIIFEWSGSEATPDQLYDLRVFRLREDGGQVDVLMEWRLPTPIASVPLSSILNPAPNLQESLVANGFADASGEYYWQVRVAEVTAPAIHRFGERWGPHSLFTVTP